MWNDLSPLLLDRLQQDHNTLCISEVNREVLLKRAEQTCSGIHPDIVARAGRCSVPPILAKALGGAQLVSCWFAFPGCNFEVLLRNDVAVAFRHDGVRCMLDSYAQEPECTTSITFTEWKQLKREDFNAQLLDNLMIALRGVTGKGDIVADSRHFVAVMAKAIEKLDAVSKRLREFQPDNIEDVADTLDDIKLEVFRHLMSKDLRK